MFHLQCISGCIQQRSSRIRATESLMNIFGRDHYTCFLCFLQSNTGDKIVKTNVDVLNKVQCTVAGILCSHCLLWYVLLRDLCNTSVSVLGDCLSMAAVQQLSRKDLEKMDEQCEEDTADTVRGDRGHSGSGSVDLT